MKKKTVVLLTVAIILLTMFYFRPVYVGRLIHPMGSENLPLKVELATFFSAHSKKEVDITSEESLGELIELIENIQVMKKVTALNPKDPSLRKPIGLHFMEETASITILTY